MKAKGIMKAKGTVIQYVLDLNKLLNSEETEVIQGLLLHPAHKDDETLYVYRGDTEERDLVKKHILKDGDFVWYKDKTI